MVPVSVSSGHGRRSFPEGGGETKESLLLAAPSRQMLDFSVEDEVFVIGMLVNAALAEGRGNMARVERMGPTWRTWEPRGAISWIMLTGNPTNKPLNIANNTETHDLSNCCIQHRTR